MSDRRSVPVSTNRTKGRFFSVSKVVNISITVGAASTFYTRNGTALHRVAAHKPYLRTARGAQRIIGSATDKPQLGQMEYWRQR